MALSGDEPLTISKGTVTLSTTIYNAANNSVVSGALPLGFVSVRHRQLQRCDRGLHAHDQRCKLHVHEPERNRRRGQRRAIDDARSAGAGSYKFDASFAGDANYNVALSGDEPLTISKGTVTLNTTIHNAAGGAAITGPVSVGISVYDTASFSGATAGFTPSISQVSYTFTTPSGTGGAGSGGQSTTQGPLGAGSDKFDASFAGDANYNAAVSGDEPLTVNQLFCPTIVTTPSPTAITLGTTGTPLKDTANLQGGYNPTGTITFTLYDPNGHLVDTETATVSGNGQYSTPTGYTLPTCGTVAGVYQWDATYKGDSNNKVATDNNDPAEQVAVITPCCNLRECHIFRLQRHQHHERHRPPRQHPAGRHRLGDLHRARRRLRPALAGQLHGRGADRSIRTTLTSRPSTGRSRRSSGRELTPSVRSRCPTVSTRLTSFAGR